METKVLDPADKRGPCKFTDSGECAAKMPAACVCVDLRSASRRATYDFKSGDHGPAGRPASANFLPGTRVRRRSDPSDTGVAMGHAHRLPDVIKVRWDFPDEMTYIGAAYLDIVR